MRNQTQFKKISVTKEVYDRIIEDKHHFESVIGGGAWSMSDTITEYFKILNSYTQDNHKKIICKCGKTFLTNFDGYEKTIDLIQHLKVCDKGGIKNGTI